MEKLRREILLGRHQPGARLPPERELALKLGTNRNTLREALRTLESEKLVRARQGDGTLVLDWRAVGEITLLPHFLAEETPIDERFEALYTLFRLRDALIDHALGFAVGNVNDADLAGCAAPSSQLGAVESGTVEAVDADIEFYRRLVVASRATVLAWVFNTFARIFSLLGRALPRAVEGRPRLRRGARRDRARHRRRRRAEGTRADALAARRAQRRGAVAAGAAAAAAARTALAQPRRAGAGAGAAEAEAERAADRSRRATARRAPALGRWSRRVVRALAEVVLPDAPDAPVVPTSQIVDFADSFVPYMPRLLRLLFPIGLHDARARRLRARALARAVLVDVAGAPPPLRRRLGARPLALAARPHQGGQGAVPARLLLRRARHARSSATPSRRTSPT